MNLILSIVIHTANILGIFTDPFEFEGNYDPIVNPIRQEVFEQVVSREALARNLTDSEVRNLMGSTAPNQQAIDDFRHSLIEQAIDYERNYGPTLGQLVTPELMEAIFKNNRFSNCDFDPILAFLEHYKDQKIFRFLRNNPPELLSLDKPLRDKAAREGKKSDLPILGSMKSLEGGNGFELKQNLAKAVFTKDTIKLAKPEKEVRQALGKLDHDYLKGFFGERADNRDLEAFASPLGQLFFYWMYHSLNLDLISTSPERIEEVNKVKKIFSETLGDASVRAEDLKEKLIAAKTEVLFTQESDALVPEILIKDGLFHPIQYQNDQDGTFVLLRSDVWEPNYKIVPIEGYEGFKKGLMNVILATRKDTGRQFLLAACHGHSTKPEDGRLQISLVMEKYHHLSDGKLQLLIGIDANTKSEEDVKRFQEHLDTLGLMSTQVGPTTIKRRMATAQHSKAGRLAIDQEDYLITLKPDHGGQFQFSHITVGFRQEKGHTNQLLPNKDNLSDHYPVGAVMIPSSNF